MIPLTVPHYFDFGETQELVGQDLVRPEAWDALRTRTYGPFALPETREQLERAAEERPEIEQRMREVDAWLEHRGVRKLASYGVGAAVAEFWLQRLNPKRRLTLTEYAPATIDRLRDLFPEAEIRQHDLRRDTPLEADQHLFHRIDTELTNRQWSEVFGRFARTQILVVATEVIDLRRALLTLRARLLSRRLTRAGWIRTRPAFERLWRQTHRQRPLRFHDLEAWALEPRHAGTLPRART
jgi:hypothetical protein